MRSHLRSQRGVASAEYSIYLVIAALVMAAAIIWFFTNMTKDLTIQFTRDLVTVDSRAKGYAHTHEATDVNTFNLSQAGVFKDVTSIIDKNGRIDVLLGGRTSGSDHSFEVFVDPNFGLMYFMSPLDLDVCMPLMTQLAKTASFISINNNIVKAPGGVANPYKARCESQNGSSSFSIQIAFP